jgi:hypothetical protein
MKYKTGNAFRRALETRLLNQSRQSGLPLVRLRKMVAFERFLARLAVEQPENWFLKGGLALQWRLGNRARTTKDVDVSMTVPGEKIHRYVFEKHNTHPVPSELPDPPEDCRKPFGKMAGEVGLMQRAISEATPVAQAFVNPVLRDLDYRQWHPIEWRWH